MIFYYKDNMLVTNEDHIPIVEIDDSHASSIMQDFLWFTKVSHNLPFSPLVEGRRVFLGWSLPSAFLYIQTALLSHVHA